MSQYYSPPPPQPYQPTPNLQFYPTTYPSGPVSGHTTPSQAHYTTYNPTAHQSAYTSSGGGPSFNGVGGFGGGSSSGVSGRMGEQGGLRTGWLAAFGTEGYEGEPALLEELGVNFGHIKGKTLTVLNPLARIDQHIMDDSDLAGPILFFLLFGTFLLFSGKVHFGYIYGLALIGSLSLHTILSLMTPSSSTSPHSHSQHPASPPPSSYNPNPNSNSHELHLSSSLTLPRSASVLGYCLLPLVATSLVGVLLPMDSAGGYVICAAAIVWCTYSSSGMFCAVGRMTAMRGLVAYPLGLFYAGFGIMVIFSSKGSGGLGGRVGGG